VGSTELVKSDGARLDALGRGRFDVVGWDLRGTGGSRVVRCFADERSRREFWDGLPIPTTSAQALRYLPKVLGYVSGCAARSGSLLAHVSTADDARDLDYLRRLVGDRKLTYRAVSYGTFLGQTYANMFPRHVRAMALDGVVDPRIVERGTEARFANTVAGEDRGLRAFESQCRRAGAARCALAGHGSVAKRVGGLLATLRRHPVPAPAARPSGALTYSDALVALFATLSNPRAWPQLARDLDQAVRGDGSALATVARATLAGTRTAAGDPPEAKICVDSPARRSLRAWPGVIARLTRVSFIGGPFVGWTGWAPCASWPARAADPYTGPWDATTPHPILVVGTRFDTGTPYANARRVTRLLGNAVLLTHDGYGHTSEADPSRCVERATSAYLVAVRTPRPGTVCPSDRKPFDPRFGEPLP
jgi:pimeloyl-ACP methyl ester carboxylesterase